MDKENKKAVNIWDKVAPEFSKVGPKYWNHFGKKLVELSQIKAGSKVLDIGMGRGASFFPSINKVGAIGYVVGIDNSEVMVQETSYDISSLNINNAKVVKMDATDLKFEDSFFDNVICGFGMGYLLQKDMRLTGILRVLKEEGQASFSVWGVQEDQKWLTDIVNTYLPAPSGVHQNKCSRFDSVEDLTKILYDSGFKNINVHKEDYEVIYKNKEEWWNEMWTNAVRGIFEQIENLGSDVFKEFESDISDALEQFTKTDGLHFRMPVIYAFGEK